MRDWNDQDLPGLINLYANKDVMRYYVGGPYNKLIAETCFNHFRRYLKTHGFSCWAVEHNADKKWIGQCGIRILQPWNEVSLSYILHPNYWGKGLATEAVRSVFNFAFSQLKLQEIVAWIMPDNKASLNVASKMGMSLKREEVYKNHLFYVMSLNQEDWSRKPS